jgi:hypothetical protein
MTYTTQKQLRRAFWESQPHLDAEARRRGIRSRPQNQQHQDTRYAWTLFLDNLHRNGEISDALAFRATL